MKIITTYRRFAVIGPNQPTLPEDRLLQAIFANRLQVGDLGVPEPVEYGWSGARYLGDADIHVANNVFNDCLLFALRIDTNKVPAEIRKSYQMQEEELLAKDNPSGFISKKQKKDAKDTVKRKLEDELKSGKHRRSRLIPVLWDLPNQVLYTPAAGESQEKLLEIFQRTFNLDLQPLSAGSIALRTLEPQGHRRDYEDLKPTRFVPGPGGESHWPDYPWVLKGPEPKDFLGNEFLLWLWFHSEGQGMPHAADGFTVMLDRALELDCAYGESGKDSLRSVGVAKMPEAYKALAAGKLPRKAGIVLGHQGAGYQFTLQAETFAISGLKLPEVEQADSPRTLLEEQITQLRDFSKSIDQLYAAFLQERTSEHWLSRRDAIRTWIQKGGK